MSICRLLTIVMTFPLLMLGGCSESNQPASPAPSPATEDVNRYNTALNTHDFMDLVLQPLADKFWQSAGWIDDQYEGYYELYPTDDEGWEEVRHWAATIVELGNAMAVPGRAETRGAWLTYSRAMSDVGLTAMQAAEEQNEEDLFQAGAQLYSVCNACHQAYNPELSRFFN
jgi:hypothetical protein